MFVLSSLVVVMVTFITHSTVIVVVSACFGFILSWDIFGFALQIRFKLNGSNTMKPMTMCRSKEAIIFIIMFFLTAVISGVSSHLSSLASSEIFQSFLYVFLVLLVSLKILGDVQAVSIIFGLFRNPIYPASIESTRIFSRRKRILKYVGLIHWALLVCGEQKRAKCLDSNNSYLAVLLFATLELLLYHIYFIECEKCIIYGQAPRNAIKKG